MSRLTGNEIFELADQFRHGDEEAFTRLYEATARPQYFTALSILKDPDLAEDAVQMVFLQVYKNISTLNITSNFLAWLSKITYNTCLNILKSRKRSEKEGDEEELLELPDPRCDINPLHQVIGRENRMLILSLLEDLSLEHRTILILRYYQDLKVVSVSCAAGVLFLGAAKTLPQPFIKEAGIEKPQAYTSKKVRIDIEATVKTPESLKAHYENGESLKIIQDSPEQFHTMAPRNGRITISIEKGGGPVSEKDIEVTQIDRESPKLLKHVYEKDRLRLYLLDDLSGINYDKIRVLLDGSPKPLLMVNEAENYIEVPYDRQESLSLYMKDEAGNTREVELEAVEITTER